MLEERTPHEVRQVVNGWIFNGLVRDIDPLPKAAVEQAIHLNAFATTRENNAIGRLEPVLGDMAERLNTLAEMVEP